MNGNVLNFRQKAIRWKQFSRHSDAAFLSLGKEISMGVLSVSTLLFAAPQSSSAHMAMKDIAVVETEEREAETPATQAEVMDLPVIVASQNDDTDGVTKELENLTVIGTRAPMPPDKAVRLVQVLTRKDIEMSSAQTVNDILKLAAGVDVRQRGAFGIQTDIGVNGGTQDQVTVLLNNVNITSAHTGHLTMDLPVSIDDIERIEILEGGASRVYGASAFSGAINIVTKKVADKEVSASLMGGQYGTFDGKAALGFTIDKVKQRVSGGYARSNGGTDNGDFNKSNGFYQGSWRSKHFDLDWQAGLSSMNYGANTFYSAKHNNQYEENNRIITSIRGEYKGRIHVIPQLSWIRSNDHYVLNRKNPSAYENFHKADTYGAALNAWTEWVAGKTSLGFEMRRENIMSSSLGKPLNQEDWIQVEGRNAYYKDKDGRTNWNIHLEHNVIINKVSLAVGVLANKNTALNYGMHFYPGVDVSWNPADGWRLYASFGQSLRMPTYTDLYYTGPNIQGNPDIKPERSTDVSIGTKFAQGSWQAQVKGFYRRGTNMIDWVKYSADDKNHAANLDLDYYGIDVVSSFDGNHQWGKDAWLKRTTLSYSFVHQDKINVPQNIYSSNYALDYLKHKFVLSLTHRIVSRLEAQWDFTLRTRNGEFDLYSFDTESFSKHPYGTNGCLDLKLQWTERQFKFIIQASNLTNHRYYDINNVLQPGMWVMGGIKWSL